MDIIIREMKQSDWRPVSNISQEGIKTKTATFEQDAPEYEEWNQSHFPTCRLVAANDSIDRDGRTPCRDGMGA